MECNKILQASSNYFEMKAFRFYLQLYLIRHLDSIESGIGRLARLIGRMIPLEQVCTSLAVFDG